MRSFSCLVAGVLLAVTSVANAEAPLGRADHSPQVMLYVQKTLGPTSRRNEAPSFGLSLSREWVTANRDSITFGLPRARLSMLDLRWSLAGKRSMLMAGIPMWDSESGSYGLCGGEVLRANADADNPEDGGSLESLCNPTLQYVAMGLAAISVACLAQWGICKGSNRNPPDTATPTGPG
jgi:hypothetical protein